MRDHLPGSQTVNPPPAANPFGVSVSRALAEDWQKIGKSAVLRATTSSMDERAHDGTTQEHTGPATTVLETVVNLEETGPSESRNPGSQPHRAEGVGLEPTRPFGQRFSRLSLKRLAVTTGRAEGVHTPAHHRRDAHLSIRGQARGCGSRSTPWSSARRAPLA